MSSTTDPGNRSAAEIEREVERTRAGLTETLDELRERASPGQLFEQAIDYARSSGGTEMMRNLGQQVRDNPLPLLLIGAGIGWMMLSGGSRGGGGMAATGSAPGRATAGSARYRVYGGSADAAEAGSGPSTLGRVRDSVAGAADQAIDKAGQSYRSVTDAAGSAADSLRGAAGSAADSAREAAGAVADSLGGAASMVADRLSGTGQDLREQAGEMGAQARQGIGWLVREQPLVLGAIGVALGAAVGALLPGTEAENRLMGQTRDALADRVQETAQQGYEQLKETAGEHLEHAKSTIGGAAGEGNTGQVGAALTEAARGVRQVVRDAAHDVADQARGSMEGQPRRDDAASAQPSPDAPRIGPA
ncbi:DUF3618 domain-containing protein [Roseicella aquatilis]|uniref:DUF3618 domain-containing protein n=1 Tax=Roseicella aquatilis TaxID=2527868 RepID=A0A4R4D4J6_9PROT|nr:DUF3618 domain-containing protein [Roseicella aquatilis]TCZ54986.1 DUF3618 domain-containing protein [Roseicella aquatilis]